MIGLWIILTVLAALRGLSVALPINLWSVTYMGIRLESNPTIVVVNTPENHPHAGNWLAEDALNESKFVISKSLAMKQAKNGDSYAQFIMGKLLLKQGNFDSASEFFRNSKAFHPILNFAQESQNTGHIKEAEFAYEIAYAINPQEGTLPYVNFMWDKYRENSTAEEMLQQSIAKYDRSKYRLSWWYRLGEIFKELERWDDAHTVYLEILSEYPNEWRAQIELGWVMYEQGFPFLTSENAFKAVIEKYPSRGDGFFAIGQFMVKQQKYDDADYWFSEAIERNPELGWWRIHQAKAARNAGNFPYAIQILEEALVHFPEYSQIYYEIAPIYLEVNEPGKAINAIQTAIMLDENDEWFYVRAGQIYESIGEDENALNAYQTALDINANNGHASAGIDRILRNDA